MDAARADSDAADTTETFSRIAIAGPELELKPDAVHSLTLALNELATNAAKYGALSVPEGRVAIAWQLRDGAGTATPRFHMSWMTIAGQLDRIGAKRVMLTHMAEPMLARRGEVADARVVLAEDGLVLDV